MKNQSVLSLQADDRSLLTPIWHVSITTRRSEWEPPPTVAATIEADAETLGVDLRLDSQRCIAQFFAHGATLRAATDSAFEHWDSIRFQLGLPEWLATSLLVTQVAAESTPDVPHGGRLHCRSASTSRATSAPGYRYPYYLWNPG